MSRVEKKYIGSRIREIRKFVLKLTQEEFASRLGVAGSYISRIEKGKNVPSELLIKAICREFGVYEEWLRTGRGPRRHIEVRLEDQVKVEAELTAKLERGLEDLAYKVEEGAKGYEAALPQDETEILAIYRRLAPHDRALMRKVLDWLLERRRED